MSKAIITESHLTDIANAIIAKGGADAPLKPSEMAAAVAAIPTGGDTWREWWMGADWPNLREIVETDVADEEGFTHKVAFLVEKFKRGDYLSFLYADDGDGTYFRIRTDDGRWLTSNVRDYKVDFPDDPADFFGCHWVIVYIKDGVTLFNGIPLPCLNHSSLTDLPTTMNLVWMVADAQFDFGQMWYKGWGNNIGTRDGLIAVENITFIDDRFYLFRFIGNNNSANNKITVARNCYFESSYGSGSEQKFRNSYCLTELVDCTLNIRGSAARWFENNYNIRRITGSIISDAENYSLDNMFSWCKYLIEIPTIDFSKAISTKYMFSQCLSLSSIQDDLNLSALTSSPDYMFDECYSLRNLPRMLKGPNGAFNYTLSFSSSDLIDPASLAEFEGGALTGGMVYNLNDVTNDGGYTRTITLPTTLRAKFTDDEATAIIDAANAKGWTLGNFAL